MTAHAFVIHGIGNRDEVAFRQTVAMLAARIGGVEAHPLYWGDLCPDYELISHTVPGGEDTLAETRDGEYEPDPTIRALAEFLGGARTNDDETRSSATVPGEVLDSAANAATGRAFANEEVRDDFAGYPDAYLIREAIERHWPKTSWLHAVDNPELLRAIGEAVGSPIGDQTAEIGNEVRGDESRGLDVVGSNSANTRRHRPCRRCDHWYDRWQTELSPSHQADAWHHACSRRHSRIPASSIGDRRSCAVVDCRRGSDPRYK